MNGPQNNTEWQGGLKSIDDIENKYLRGFWKIIAALFSVIGKLIFAFGAVFVALCAVGSQVQDEQEDELAKKKADWSDPSHALDPTSPYYDMYNE